MLLVLLHVEAVVRRHEGNAWLWNNYMQTKNAFHHADLSAVHNINSKQQHRERVLTRETPEACINLANFPIQEVRQR